MRKCRLSTCRQELPKVKDSDWSQSKGFCNIDHMATHGYAKALQAQERRRKAQEREARAEHRKAREKIKTRSEWAAEAQSAVNAYVRERDKGKPCISCDKPDDGSHQRHASHYRSVKACSILRFDPRNIYASCAQCNAHMSGNLLEYRIRLIRKHGQDLVEWLESQNGIVRYSIGQLKAIKAEYKEKLKYLRDQPERHPDGCLIIVPARLNE